MGESSHEQGYDEKIYFAEKKRKRSYFYMFAAILAIVSIAIYTFSDQHTYTKRKWDTNREGRYKIVDDMLEQHHLAGMTEAEVILLLGNEDNNEQTSFKISRDTYSPE